MYKLIWLILLCVSCNLKNKNSNNVEILFENKNLNIGEIAYKSVGEYQFKFRNIGTEPIKIESVNLSCSCLGAEWSKTEISPKDTGIIVVTTNTGRLGRFSERISVHYNGIKSPEVLSLTGNIIYNKKE